MTFKTATYARVNYMFDYFTENACERDWPIVFRQALLSFFEDRDDVGRLPILRYFTSQQCWLKRKVSASELSCVTSLSNLGETLSGPLAFSHLIRVTI